MKILMALMGLDIGGAETHVVELSKELKSRGNEIVVVSAGGPYQQEIEAAGIKHYYAPLLSHSPVSMLKAFFILKKVIAAEKPDIVHAHARIPALIIHNIHKFNKSFTFVTSVHYPFNTKGLMGKLSRWGSRQLAVSEDLKRYVTQNYKKVKPSTVHVSVNGIDTEKFSSELTGEEIVKEFGLNPEARRIVYVSRLDKEVCTPVYALLEITPRLLESVPDLEIIIVGKGTGLDELSAKAEEINGIAGRTVVVTTGARTDVNKINACATFCIGVSRSILEAMAEEKPSILAGNYGYMGIFTEDKLLTAFGNNFTCRNTGTLDNETLYNDVMTLCTMDQEKFRALGEYSRSVVLDNYSVRKMAYDNFRMYEEALHQGKYDVAILGYYGFRNSGDDALLHSIVDSLKKRKEDVRIAVFSNMPEETASIYKVHSINRFGFFAVRKTLKNTKLFIMGGGSLLQDGTSFKSLLYYTYILNLAKKKCKKTMLYANGIGPLERKISEKSVARALKGVDVITLRDADSLIDVNKMGITENVYVTADPVFSLDKIKSLSAIEEMKNRGIKKGDKYVCISARKWHEQPESFISGFADMCDYIATEYGYKIIFIPMQYPYDARIIRSIASQMKSESCFIDKRLSANEILTVIEGSEFTIGVRLHLLIYASTVAVPGIGIVYDPKVSSFQRYINQPYFIEPRGLTAGDYKIVIDQCVKNRESVVAELEKTSVSMKEKSEQTADIAIELLKE